MNHNQRIKRSTLFTAIFAAVCLLLVLLFIAYRQYDAGLRQSRETTERRVLEIGVSYAKQKCVEEGLALSVCSTISGYVTPTDYVAPGQYAYIVSVATKDDSIYSAGVTVTATNSNELSIYRYGRSKISHP